MLWLHRVVTSCLSTKEECIEFVSAFKDFGILLVPDTVAGLLPTEVPAVETVLKVYNAVLQRLKRFQVPLSEDMILYGIQLAGLAKSTAAMKKFVELSLNPDLEHHLKLITITLRHFHKWADTECFDDPHGQRQKQQLGLILTGHKGRGTSGTMEREAGCVYHLMTARGGSIRWRYLDAVRKFSGTNALFEEWLDFNKSTLQMRKVVNHNQGDLEALQIWNKFIREFILAGDVPKAWRVVEESGLPFTEVSNSTWETMFEHAEQISEWHGVMEPRLLRRYYRLLRGIEYAMGIQWTGGEHGEHIPRRRSSLSDDIE
ncbi:hypothetical protein MMC19_006622 [Ptychographa xylographoides]|nr:hypothetical protein [Ptychographa xylographoides]